jgi:hypothetical protein
VKLFTHLPSPICLSAYFGRGWTGDQANLW